MNTIGFWMLQEQHTITNVQAVNYVIIEKLCLKKYIYSLIPLRRTPFGLIKVSVDMLNVEITLLPHMLTKNKIDMIR
jgi:hypothetical protein